MKVAVTIIVFLAIALIGAGASSQATVAKVSIAATTTSVREGRYTRTDTLLLWNRNVRSRPIGYAVKSCMKTAIEVMNCSITVVLPHGKVVATGLVHNLRQYTLVVTGGTGEYIAARGPLFVRAITGDGVRRLTFQAS